MTSEVLYTGIVVLLFILAFSDLIVGVSNDAVNFLNSAIGSKVAPYKVIMGIATVGVLLGATFSEGMMEVARKGVFNPEKFYFDEIMLLFLAVMITDVFLLDLFNSYGLPTSTTVSIVFELLGAAVGVALLKTWNTTEGIETYINTENAIKIILGILLSVFVAFNVGAIIQFITRLIFSFKYERALKYFGAVWGGIAITSITFFILIKGAKGSALLDKNDIAWIMQHKGQIILYSFVGWTIILQILKLIFNWNILKIIVLIGTLSLAMAFAGNDLVNFIGVPLAGYASYQAAGAENMLMSSLTERVETPTYMLIIAGLVMSLTLWFSKKAQSVVKTSVDLSRQNEGEERFKSSKLALMTVNLGNGLTALAKQIIPSITWNWMNSRFVDQAYYTSKNDTAFDLLRASVNLVVASILIAIGTAQKLPLSTTYVTFMVAMGTSLADRAWASESAAQRITGVFAVIAGWFFTAFAAFCISSIVAILLIWGKGVSIIIMCSSLGYLIYRSHRKSNV